MMQMQENNGGVEKMSNSWYFQVLKQLNREICKISNSLYVTNSHHVTKSGVIGRNVNRQLLDSLEEEKVAEDLGFNL